MIDIPKLFEVIKSKNDQDARVELERLLAEESDLEPLITAGYKVVQSSGMSMFSGYGTATVSDTDLKESSLFSFAVYSNRPYCAAYLLQRLSAGILLKPNEKKENGFHAVARSETPTFIEWFLKESCVATMAQVDDRFKAAINQITTAEQHVLSLLNLAKTTEQEIHLWFKLGANPQYTGVKPGNFLHLCCEKNRPDLVRYLVEHHRNLILAPNDKGQLPVHAALSLNSMTCLELLINAGSPLSVEDRLFNRPLHHVIVKGSYQAARTILQKEQTLLIGFKQFPYVNVSNSSLETPLHLLMTYNKAYNEKTFQDTLDLLLEYGADFTLLNDKGQTPLRLAKELLSSEKMSHDMFKLVWLKFHEKYNPQLFTRDVLFQLIRQSFSPDQASLMIYTLSPLLANQSPDPYQLIRVNQLDNLRQLAAQIYRDQPQILEPFLAILNQLTQIRPNASSGNLATFQYQASPAANSRQTNDVNMLGNQGWDNRY